MQGTSEILYRLHYDYIGVTFTPVHFYWLDKLYLLLKVNDFLKVNRKTHLIKSMMTHLLVLQL